MGIKLTNEEVFKRIKEKCKQNVEVTGEYENKRSKISLRCLDCGYEWNTIAAYVLYRDNHECPNCGLHVKQNNVFYCANCGKEVIRRNSDVNKNVSGNFYCSRECGNQHKNDIRKQTGEWDNAFSSYRTRAFDTYDHKCCVCGWDDDERVLEVHHIDKDRTNNLINNLCILCPTCHKKITLNYYQLTSDFQLIENS